MTDETLAEGWTFPTDTARRMHYFRGPERRSLCGRYAAWKWAELRPDHEDRRPHRTREGSP
jgi:hypothetical protein